MKRLIAVFMVASLLLAVGLALAAELDAVEVIAGTDNAVIEVAQGGTVTFDIRVTSTIGVIRNAVTSSNPANVRVDTVYTVAPNGSGVTVGSSSTPSDPLSFWASGTSGQATAPAPADGYTLTGCSATAAADAAPGDYVIRIAMTTYTPGDYPPGHQLRDETADYLTIRVVAAGPPPDTEAPTGRITINGGALYTNSTAVTLNLAATDNVAVTQYRIANGTDASGGTVVGIDPGVTPFTANVSWPVPSGDGSKTVAVQYGDAVNWSANYTATITLDQTNPVVTITIPAGGGYYTTATLPALAYTATDNLDPNPAVVVSGWSTAEGVHTVTVTATDAAGNVGSASVTYTVDNAPPVITITTPAAGAVYLLNQEVFYSFTVTDANLDEVTTTPDVESGDAIDTSTVGRKTFIVTATDLAGNTATTTVTYDVRYAFSGFLPPIKPLGTTSFSLKGNGTLPVKFVLRDAFNNSVRSGLSITAPFFTRVGAVGEDVSGTPLLAESTSKADSGNFRWCPVEQQYIFNLSTKNLTVGIYVLTVVLPDGTNYSCWITLTK